MKLKILFAYAAIMSLNIAGLANADSFPAS